MIKVFIILLIVIIAERLFSVHEKFGGHFTYVLRPHKPFMMRCSKCLDSIPKYIMLNNSGGIKYTSSKDPLLYNKNCKIVTCPPLVTDLDGSRNNIICHTCSSTIEGMENIDDQSLSNPYIRSSLYYDAPLSVSKHVILDKFNRVKDIDTTVPLPRPGENACVKQLCPNWLNGNNICWKCE